MAPSPEHAGLALGFLRLLRIPPQHLHHPADGPLPSGIWGQWRQVGTCSALRLDFHPCLPCHIILGIFTEGTVAVFWNTWLPYINRIPSSFPRRTSRSLSLCPSHLFRLANVCSPWQVWRQCAAGETLWVQSEPICSRVHPRVHCCWE